MIVLQRLAFPRFPDSFGLYFKSPHPVSFDGENSVIRLRRGRTLSLGTYVNSFYLSHYLKHASPGELHYQLDLRGEFRVELYAESFGRPSERLSASICSGQGDGEACIVLVSACYQGSVTPGRIFLKLACLSEEGEFRGGRLVSGAEAVRPVGLGIVICTYRREEYVRNTLKGILSDKGLMERNIGIFVIDNALSLGADKVPDERVRIVPNANTGGAGGFSRGMAEFIADESLTHLLLMDDDVILDPECIFRLISFYECAEETPCVAGAMFDARKVYEHFEAGARIGENIEGETGDPFSLRPLKNRLYVVEDSALDFLSLEDEADYGGFWFFSLPRETVLKAGRLLPVFVIGDDIEYGLRIRRNLGGRIATLPGFFVFHEPFYSKSFSKSYYFFRNMLIIEALYGSSGAIKVLFHLCRHFFISMVKMDYSGARLIIEAVGHFLRGPGGLAPAEQHELNEEIRQLAALYSRHEKPAAIDRVDERFYRQARPGILKSIILAATMNGRLLPGFLLPREPAFMLMNKPGQWRKAAFRKMAFCLHPEAGIHLERNADIAKESELLFSWIKRGLSFLKGYGRCKRAWVEGFSGLVKFDHKKET